VIGWLAREKQSGLGREIVVITKEGEEVKFKILMVTKDLVSLADKIVFLTLPSRNTPESALER
jgi:hypothetical protein